MTEISSFCVLFKAIRETFLSTARLSGGLIADVEGRGAETGGACSSVISKYYAIT